MKHKSIFGLLLAGTLLLSAAGCGGDPKPARHVHDWGEWQITQPTCEEKGEKKRVCKTDPTHTEREEIPALGHKWSTEWTMEVDVHYHSCENGCGERSEEGEHIFEKGKCKDCGYVLTPSELRYEEVTDGDGQTVIGYSVVGWAEKVVDRTQLVIPEEHEDKPVIAVGESAFYVEEGDETLASVYLPDSVKDLGEYAFYGCKGLKSINLGSVRNVYKGAFYECTGLKKVELGELETLGKYAFYGCASLTYARLDGVEVFEEQSMSNCPALERVDFGDGVSALAQYTFYESDNVRELSLGKAFSQPSGDFGSDIFPDGLESIEVSGENAVYCSESGILYNKSKTEMAYVPMGIKGRVTIADGVKEIKATATHFLNHAYVTSLTIPASVESIRSSFLLKPFRGCDFLAEIYDLSPSVEIADYYDLGLYEGTVIHTSLSEKSVVTDPDGDGFVWRTDADILHAYFGREAEPILPSGHDGNGYSVGARAFSGCAIERISVPSAVSALGEYCFNGCIMLQEVALGEGLREIGTGAFYGCEALAKITIPKSVKKVGAGAFYDCGALERVAYAGMVSDWAAIEFENSNSNIFVNAMQEKQATLYLGDGDPLPEKIVIEGIEKIGNYAFFGAPIQEVRIGSGVKNIGQDAFTYCAELKMVVLGKVIESFSHAFSSGSPIEKFYYEGTQETWDTLNNGNGGSSALRSAEVYFFAEADPDSGNAWHYGANGEIEEW